MDMTHIPFSKKFNECDECVEATFYRKITSPLIWKTLRFLKVGNERRMLDALKHLMDCFNDIIAFKNKEIMISNGGAGEDMRYLLTCFMRKYQHDELNVSHQFLQGNPKFTIRKAQSSIYF
jgi:fatty acid omega-hydroxylase